MIINKAGNAQRTVFRCFTDVRLGQWQGRARQPSCLNDPFYAPNSCLILIKMKRLSRSAVKGSRSPQQEGGLRRPERLWRSQINPRTGGIEI